MQLDISEIAYFASKLSEKDLEGFLLHFTDIPFSPLDLIGKPKEELLKLVFMIWERWEKEFKKEEDYLRHVTRQMCKSSFEFFVRFFWDEVPGSQPLLWNWHLRIFCEAAQSTLEYIFRGETPPENLIINVSPGTSKSSVWSILLQCWAWVRMPDCKFITASHAIDLVMDLSAKSRDVLKGELYGYLFPEIEFTESQDAKGHYRNTKGGERFVCTVGGKSPIGKHAHVVVCLPYGSAIITEWGCLPIGEIVEKKLPVRVLGYDHQKGCKVWQEIEEYESSPGRSLCSVNLSDGTVVEATEDHPFYVVGKGYIQVGLLIPGDEVLCAGDMSGEVLRMRWEFGGLEKQEEVPEMVLHFSLLGNELEKEQYSQVLGMREGILPLPQRYQKRRWQTNILFPCLLGNRYLGNETSQIFQHRERLFRLWQEDSCAEESFGDELVLQQQMLWKGFQGGEESQVYTKNLSCMRDMRQEDAKNAGTCSCNQLLFPRVQKQSSFYTNDGRWKFKLSSRAGIRSLPNRIQQYVKNQDKEERRIPLFSVRQNTEAEWKSFGGASYRLEQKQLRDEQFSCSLPYVSQKRGCCREEVATGKKTVTSVEFGLRIPEKVYNLRIKDTHNYFAEGILLHNCDDPLDPTEALSEAGKKTAENFLARSISTRRMRGKQGDIFVIILVMQRLGVGDSTDVLLQMSRMDGGRPVKHICLPAEITDNVSPPELKKFYQGWNEEAGRNAEGLMDPIRLSKAVLKNHLVELRQWGYAGQFLQAPRPEGGGMFKRIWYSQRQKAAPYNARRIRYWDRAASSSVSACATCGTLVAYDGNKIYIEDQVYGHWEPDERNAVMIATAQRDRLRYQKNEPVIYIERERGSTGKESFQYMARKLFQLGFTRVREDAPEGSKDTRAEPFADGSAAGMVVLIDNGGNPAWDIEGFLTDLENFRPSPGVRLGREKDRLDSTSGAYNLFLVKRRMGPVLQSYTIGGKKNETLRFIVCKEEDLDGLEIDERMKCVIIYVDDPKPSLNTIINEGGSVKEIVDKLKPGSLSSTLPQYCLNRTIGSIQLNFADMDSASLQESWDRPVEPWGLLPEKVVLQRDMAKNLWQFLLKKRDEKWGICVIVEMGGDDSKAISLAAGLADGYRLPRSVVYRPSDPDTLIADVVPNPYICETIKSCRNLVHS